MQMLATLAAAAVVVAAAAGSVAASGSEAGLVAFELARFAPDGTPVSANAATVSAACRALDCETTWVDADPGDLRELPFCNVEALRVTGTEEGALPLPSAAPVPPTSVCMTGDNAVGIVAGLERRGSWARRDGKYSMQLTDPATAMCVTLANVSPGEKLVVRVFDDEGTLLAVDTLDQLPPSDDSAAPIVDLQQLRIVAGNTKISRVEIANAPSAPADAGDDAAPGFCITATASSCACAADERQCCGVRPELNPPENPVCGALGEQKIEAENLVGVVRTGEPQECAGETQRWIVVPDGAPTFNNIDDNTGSASGNKYVQTVSFSDSGDQPASDVKGACNTFLVGDASSVEFEDEYPGPALAYPVRVGRSGTYSLTFQVRCVDGSKSATDSLYTQVRDADGNQVTNARRHSFQDCEDDWIESDGPQSFELEACQLYYVFIAKRENGASVDFFTLTPDA